MDDQLVETIAQGLVDAKARGVRVIDMRRLEEAAAMWFVVCEGTSSTHVAGIADALEDYVRLNTGIRPSGCIGLGQKQWVAIDYGHVLVHIFQPETRQFYRLEELWSDVPSYDVEEGEIEKLRD